jgi:hypothetical protein
MVRLSLDGADLDLARKVEGCFTGGGVPAHGGGFDFVPGPGLGKEALTRRSTE